MKLEELKKKGAASARISGQDVILMAMGEKVHALSAVCTHRGCIVEYNERDKTIDCPCHGSVYDLAGNPTDGPAKAPLAKINVKVDGDEIKLA